MMNEAYLKAIIARVELGRNELTDFPQDVKNELELVEGKLSIKKPTVETAPPQPTLEQRVEAVEEVTTEVITALNEKGIVP